MFAYCHKKQSKLNGYLLCLKILLRVFKSKIRLFFHLLKQNKLPHDNLLLDHLLSQKYLSFLVNLFLVPPSFTNQVLAVLFRISATILNFFNKFIFEVVKSSFKQSLEKSLLVQFINQVRNEQGILL